MHAHQGAVHEIVESVILESLFLDGREHLRRVTTKIPREEKTADQKSLDLIFKGYREDFQSDPRQPRKNRDVVEGFLLFLQARLQEIRDGMRIVSWHSED